MKNFLNSLHFLWINLFFFFGNLIFISYQHENLYGSKIDITTQLLAQYDFDDYDLKLHHSFLSFFG